MGESDAGVTDLVVSPLAGEVEPLLAVAHHGRSATMVG
jgi:hypothetical protein